MTDAPRAEFRSQLIVRELDTGDRMLTQDLVFYSADLAGELIAVAGSITDYVSSPPPAWSIIPRDGPAKWAAVMHDGAYRGTLVTRAGFAIHLTKPLADRLFLEAMIATGVSRWKRRLMYALVSRYGGRPYGGLGAVQHG